MTRSGVRYAIFKAVVFDVDVVFFGDDSVESLTVGTPQIVVVDLLRIEADATGKA